MLQPRKENNVSGFFPIYTADSQRGRGVGLGTGGAVGSTCAWGRKLVELEPSQATRGVRWCHCLCENSRALQCSKQRGHVASYLLFHVFFQCWNIYQHVQTMLYDPVGYFLQGHPRLIHFETLSQFNFEFERVVFPSRKYTLVLWCFMCSFHSVRVRVHPS